MNVLSRLFRKPQPDPLAECTCSHQRRAHDSWRDSYPGRCGGTRPVGVDYDEHGRPQRYDERPCTCETYTSVRYGSFLRAVSRGRA